MASILKVRDQDGQIIEIPAFRGKQGIQGDKGEDGVGIDRIEIVEVEHDTGGFMPDSPSQTEIIIWLTNGNYESFVVPSGKDGVDGVGIQGIEKTSTDGLVDTYTITMTDGSTNEFTVTNGANGSGGMTPDGVNITLVDPTLTMEGAAADAKATGDKLRLLEEGMQTVSLQENEDDTFSLVLATGRLQELESVIDEVEKLINESGVIDYDSSI